MKKTVATLALSASSAVAVAAPQPVSETKTYCLTVYESEQGSQYAGSCDETANNQTLGKPILANGCAEQQVALSTIRVTGETNFEIEIGACLPPNVVQL